MAGSPSPPCSVVLVSQIDDRRGETKERASEMDTVGTNQVLSEMPTSMTDESRLRRKQLRRRPMMLQKAMEYGLLCDDDHWTVVTHKGGKK